MIKCKRCGEEKTIEDFYTYNNRSVKVCKKCKIKENGIRKIQKDYKYESNYVKKEKIIDDEFRNEIIDMLFPSGIAPNWFIKNYLN